MPKIGIPAHTAHKAKVDGWTAHTGGRTDGRESHHWSRLTRRIILTLTTCFGVHMSSPCVKLNPDTLLVSPELKVELLCDDDSRRDGQGVLPWERFAP